MGLISQIEKNSHAKKIEQKISVVEISAPDQTTPIPKKFPAAPCPTCRSPKFWFDRYSAEPHCRICQPPPSRALVARLDDVVTLNDGSFAWALDRASDATSEGDAGDRSAGGVLWLSEESFNQRYRCYQSRDGKREIIERRDWTFLNSMIAEIP